MTDDISRRIEDCFINQRVKTCSTCPAHHMKGGPCCFGDPDKHDADAECAQCDFRNDCKTEAIRAASKSYSQYKPNSSNPRIAHRIPTRTEIVQSSSARVQPQTSRRLQPSTTRTITVNRSQAPSAQPQYVQSQPIPHQQQQQMQSVQYGPRMPVATQLEHGPLEEGETMFERFVKDSVTGALQGFFEQAADFWRNHRL